jgi:hypothetical protein
MMLRRLLYTFKRQWGAEFDYIQIIRSEVDDRTGRRQIDRNVLHFRGVLLPLNQLRKFIQDIGYLAANKNFTYGALNDFNTFNILFDIHDMPPEFNPELNGYITHGHKRYERVSITSFYDQAYLLTVRGVEGANPYAEVRQRAFNTLQIQGRVTYELN